MLHRKWLLALFIGLLVAALILLIVLLVRPDGGTFADAWYV